MSTAETSRATQFNNEYRVVETSSGCRATVEIHFLSAWPSVDSANKVVFHLWQLLQRHQPYRQALEELRSHSEHQLYWPFGEPDYLLLEGLAPGSPYRKELEQQARNLAPRFCVFPWWERWLHCRAKEDGSLKPGDHLPDSVLPFCGKYDPLLLTVTISAPADRPWQDLYQVLGKTGKPTWNNLRQPYAVPRRKAPPLDKPFVAALWLFWADFLKWDTRKIVDAFSDVLAADAELGDRYDDNYRREVRLMRGASCPEEFLGWPEPSQRTKRERECIAPDHARTVRRYLLRAREFLAQSPCIDLSPASDALPLTPCL